MSVRFGLRLLVVCLALVTLHRVASAQAKVAVINLQKAVLDSAEIQKASKDLTAKYQPRQQELEKLQNEIQVIQQQLQLMQQQLALLGISPETAPAAAAAAAAHHAGTNESPVARVENGTPIMLEPSLASADLYELNGKLPS